MNTKKISVRFKSFAEIGAILAALFVLAGVCFWHAERARADSNPSYTSIRVTVVSGASFTTDLTAQQLNSDTYFTVEGTTDGSTYESVDRSLLSVAIDGGHLVPNQGNNVTFTYTPTGVSATASVDGSAITKVAINSATVAVNSSYTLYDGRYWRTPENYAAFVKGMTVAELMNGLVVEVTYPNSTYTLVLSSTGNGNTFIAETGESVTVTAGGIGGDSTTVSVDITDVTGATTTATLADTIHFEEKKTVGLVVKNLDEYLSYFDEFTSSTVIYETDIEGAVFPVSNDGHEGGYLSSGEFSIDGNLAPNGEQILAGFDALAKGEEYYYTATIYVVLYSDSSVRAKIEIENVKFEEPAIGSIGGSFARQTAFGEFDYSGLTIAFNYSTGDTASIPLDSISDLCSVTYYGTDGNVIDHLSVKVNKISLTVQIGGDSRKKEQNNLIRNGRNTLISATDVNLPAFDRSILVFDPNGTYRSIEFVDDTVKDGATVTVARKSEGGVTTEIAGAYEKANDRIKFPLSGEYTVTVKLETNGDYQWVSDPLRTDNYTLVYTVQVNKATVSLSLTYASGADRVYGTTIEPTHTVTAVNTGTSASVDVFDTVQSGDNAQNPVYKFYYYETTSSADNAQATPFRDVDSYYVFVKTEATEYYNAAQSAPVLYNITKKTISTASLGSPHFDKDVTYNAASFINASEFVSAYGDSAATVLKTPVIKSVTGIDAGVPAAEKNTLFHAGTYTVEIEIDSAHFKNYEWQGTAGAKKEVTFVIQKRAVSIGVSTATNLVYGSSTNDPALVSTVSPAGYVDFGTAYYYSNYSGSGVPTSGLLSGPDFTTLDAGKYAVYFKDYAANNTNKVYASDITISGNAYSAFDIARKKITKIGFGGDQTFTYNGSAHKFTLADWNAAYAAILDVMVIGKLVDGTTAVGCSFDYATGEVSVRDAGTYTVTVAFKSSIDNHEWDGAASGQERASLDSAADGKVYEVQQAVVTIDFNIPTGGYPFDETKGQAPAPTVSVSESGVTLTVTVEYFADASQTAIDASKIKDGKPFAAGTYYVFVKDLACVANADGAGYSLAVNYRLPGSVSAQFTILSAALKELKFDNGTLAHSVEYAGRAFAFSEFIANWLAVDGQNVDQLDVTVASVNNGSVMRNVDTYTISVKPATNYKWEVGAEDAIVTLTLTVTKADIGISWDSAYDLTYTGAKKTVSPTIVVKSGSGDTVSATIKYKSRSTSDAVPTGGDVDPINAGRYYAYVAVLTGEAVPNYNIPTSGYYKDFVIKKAVIGTISVGNVSVASPTYGDGGKVTFTSSTVGWANLVTADVSRALDSAWLNGATPTVQNNVSGYSNGVFAYGDAGIYSIVFTVADSANYCLAATEQREFEKTGSYTLSINGFVTVARKELIAPALGNQRAMQYNGVTAFAFDLTAYGVSVNVLYGKGNDPYSDESATVSHGTGTVDLSQRGKYFVSFAIGSNPYNYVWKINSSDNYGSGYVDGLGKIVYDGEKSVVYLHYAIINRSLDITFAINAAGGYTFGDNGVGGSAELDNVIVMSGSNISIIDTEKEKTGFKIVYTFYKLGTASTSSSVGTVTRTWDGSQWAYVSSGELVNNLVWAQDNYTVSVELIFGKSDGAADADYQDLGFKDLAFTVKPLELQVTWSVADGDSAVTGSGTEFSSVYDGNAHTLVATVANMPKKSDSDNTTVGVTVGNRAAEQIKNAKTYTIEVKSITDNDDGNFVIPSGGLIATLTISPRAVKISGVAVTAHVYGEEILAEERAWVYTDGDDTPDTAKFVNGDESKITVTVNADKSSAVGGMYSVTPSITDGNYTVTVTPASFTVVARKITVTLNSTGKSVYGEVVNLYNGTYSVELTSGQTGDAIVNGDAVTEVFALGLDGVSDLTDVTLAAGAYDLTVSAFGNKTGNYEITFVINNATYEIEKAYITSPVVNVYGGIAGAEYDANAHAVLIASSTAVVVNGTTENPLEWYIDIGDGNGFVKYAAGTHTVKNAGTYDFKFKITAKNHYDLIIGGETPTVYQVVVNKAKLNVSVNIAITYSEQNPVGKDYRMTLADLTAGDGMYTVSGFKTGDSVSNLSGLALVAGQKLYTIAGYTSSSDATEDGYLIEFNEGAVTSDNYSFINVDGKLTVKPFEFNVVISDKSSEYYKDGDYHAATAIVSVVSKSLYDGATLSVPNGVDLDALYTLSCEVVSDGGKVTKPVKDGGYAITGALEAVYATNYKANFTDGVYTVTPAAFASVTANGYNAQYDETMHALATVNAITVDGSSATYEYYVSAVVLGDDELKEVSLWTVDAPKSIDVWAKKYVYIRISEENHATEYREVESEITKATANNLTVNFAFDNGSVKTNRDEVTTDAWTYGKFDGNTASAYYNPNGYDHTNGQSVIEPSAAFNRIEIGDTASEQYLTVAVFNGSSKLDEVTLSSGNTVGALIKSLFDLGVFGAGDYTVTVHMDGTNNYPAIDQTYYFRVGKKVLTITGNHINVVYGEDIAASVYTDSAKVSLNYSVGGYVVNGATADTWSSAVVGGTLPVFITTYVKGYENGSVGLYDITANNTSSISSNNYDLTFVKGVLSVTERTVTIKIDDKENSYNLRDDDPSEPKKLSFTVVAVNGSYSFYDDKDEVVKLKTDALTNSNASIKTNNVRVDGNGNVIPYPIYATFGTYGEGGTSFGNNYIIKFSGCSYDAAKYGAISDENAITQNGVNIAGSFTITPAKLSMSVTSPDFTYNGVAKTWQISAVGDSNVSFNIVYKNTDEDRVLAGAPIDVGNYSITYSSSDPNYTAGGEITQPFSVTKGTLTITVSNASVQYGTELFGDGRKIVENGETLFDGVTASYEFSADGEFTTGDDIAQKIIARETDKGALDLTKLYFKYGNYTVHSAPSENGYKMSVNFDGTDKIPSANYNIVMSVDTSKNNLTVVKRNVTVTVHGYNFDGSSTTYEGAKGEYTGQDHTFAINAKLADSAVFNGYFSAPNGWAGQSGDALKLLNLTLELENAVNNEYDVGYYAMSAKYSNVNYNVTFKYNDDGNGAYYRITQKKLTVYAQGLQDGVYRNQFAFTYGNTENFIIAFTGFVADENFDSLCHGGKAGGDYKFDTDYVAWVSGVGTDAYYVLVSGTTDGDSGIALWFKNYAIEYASVNFSVVPRVITASTTDRVYTEDIVGGVVDYHGGSYGATLKAIISFGNIPADKISTYAPVYTDVYSGAGTTPNKAGKYTVSVTLAANGNYKFADGYTWTYGDYNITKKSISVLWNRSTINLDDGETERTITGYIADIMEFGNRGFTLTANGLTESVPTSKYTVSNSGLVLTVTDNGTYSAHIALNAAASANYYLSNTNTDDGTVILNLIATTDYVNLQVSIIGWVYGSAENDPHATVDGEEKQGITFYFATSSMDYASLDGKFKDGSFDNDDWLIELGLVGGFVSRNNWRANAGTHVVYGEYAATGQRAYFVFEIEQKEVTAPVVTSDSTNDTYTGGQLVLEVKLDRDEIFVTADGLTIQNTTDGISLYALDAKTYEVVFTLASNNYKWSAESGAVDGKVIKQWIVGKADGEITDLSVSDITYGESVAPTASAKFGASISFVYKAKTADEVNNNAALPASDTGWSSAATTYKEFGYWVKAISSGTNNYSSASAYASFFIAKKEVRVTAYGGFIYGATFSATGNYNGYEFNAADFVLGNGASRINVDGSAIRYELVDAPSKLPYGTYGITLKADADGYVIGMTAENYVVKAVVGEFSVSKRPIAVTVGNASSYYSLTPNLSNVSLTADALAFDDTVAMLGISLSTTANSNSAVGTYLINIDSYNADNYEISFTPGLLSVQALPIFVSVTQGGGEYGGTITEPKLGAPSSTVSGVDMQRVFNELTLTFRYVGTSNSGVSWDSEEMPTLAGNYTARITGVGSNFRLANEQSAVDFVIEKKLISQSLITVRDAVYDGANHTPVIIDDTYGDEYYYVGSGIYINAGTHQVILTLTDEYNTTWDGISVSSCTVPFVVTKANNELITGILMNNWTFGDSSSVPQATTLYGAETQYIWRYYDEAGKQLNGVPSNAGRYYVSLYVPEGDNYNALAETRQTFTILKRVLDAPKLTLSSDGENKNDIYTGGELYSAVVGFNNVLMSMSYAGSSIISGDSITLIAVNAGTYTVIFGLADSNNYAWENVDADSVELEWTVARKRIAKPTADGNTFIVSGKPIEYIPNGFDENTMIVSGNVYGYGGEFTATVSLTDPDNYEWEDGTQDDIELGWKIVGAHVVFNTVVGVLGGAAAVAAGFAVAQVIIRKRKKRLVEQAMNAMDAGV